MLTLLMLETTPPQQKLKAISKLLNLILIITMMQQVRNGTQDSDNQHQNLKLLWEQPSQVIGTFKLKHIRWEWFLINVPNTQNQAILIKHHILITASPKMEIMCGQQILHNFKRNPIPDS